MVECIKILSLLNCMRILSRNTANQTRGSRLGSMCGSRTAAMQKISCTYWRP